MTEAKILFCENCNATVTDTGIGSVDPGTRVITIIEATDELDGNAVMSSNAISGDRRLKRGVEAVSLAGNDTASEDGPALADEMIDVNLDVPRATPVKRFADRIQPDMTQAIMEQRLDYDVNEEFRAASGHGYDTPRIGPANRFRGRGHAYRPGPLGESSESAEEHLEDADGDDSDDGDHNSHYEYVPMEFDDEGNHRPLTLPNFLDSKKPAKSSRYGAPYKKPYARPSNYRSGGFGNGPPPPPSSSSSSLPVHGHDFVPLRGTGAGGYSYGTGLPGKNFDDYHDGPSSYHHSSSSDGPKSFVSMSSNLNEDDLDGVINIDHGRAYDPSSDDRRYRPSSPYGAQSSSHYRSGDPLHPLRNYHASDHQNEHMYDRLRQEYQRKSSVNPVASLSPYFQHYNDYNEPSSTSVQSRRYDVDADGGDDGKKAYWSMSYTQGT
uniref:Uncharacterized protein n=1 Tax=Sipha flava TaxID=143950 RepID=A0A2S2QBX3_9HEMI